MNRIEKTLLFLAGAAVWGEVLMYVVLGFGWLFGVVGFALVLVAALFFAWHVSRDSRSEGRAAFGGLALCLLAASFLHSVTTPQRFAWVVGAFVCGHLLFSFAVFSRLYGFGKPATTQ